MISSVLVANRGEIALRVGRTCERLGITPHYVYELADQSLPHAQTHNSTPVQSYNNPAELVEVAVKVGAEAIHPGYGFASENALFPQFAAEAGLEFVGPSFEAMTRLGNKQEMLRQTRIADIPRIPGSFLDITDITGALDAAERIGFPVLAKGTASGGGRQIKLLQTGKDVEAALGRLRKENKAEEVYIQKFMTNVKHIEVQLLGDKQGTVVSLGTRDCSVQRRFQKLIEEAPSMLPESVRLEVEQAAVRVANLADYVCASTVEFLVDEDYNYYFMEVNPRLQVEHCVTEEVYGVDIVEHQLRVTAGESLDHALFDLTPQGHSIQCRINAEDPSNEFLPTAGRLTEYRPPKEKSGKVRFESFLRPDIIVPTVYDSLVAKLIVRSATRAEAISTMLAELERLKVEGFPTTIPFFKAVLKEKFFVAGHHKTSYIQLFQNDLLELMAKEEIK